MTAVERVKTNVNVRVNEDGQIVVGLDAAQFSDGETTFGTATLSRADSRRIAEQVLAARLKEQR